MFVLESADYIVSDGGAAHAFEEASTYHAISFRVSSRFHHRHANGSVDRPSESDGTPVPVPSVRHPLCPDSIHGAEAMAREG